MTIKRIFRIVKWVFVMSLFMIVSLAFYASIPLKTTSTLYIPEGSVGTIITQLIQKGYALSEVDKYLLTLIGTPKTGWIHIGQTDLNRIDFLHKLVTAKAQMIEVTLIPGETTQFFLQDLATKLQLDYQRLASNYDLLAHYKEAGIHADTYSVPLGIKEKHLIYFLVSHSEQKYEEFSSKFYGNYRQEQWNRILTIASIIQKEAASEEEMGLVSSVIYNRLDHKMPLQMDGSLNYGAYSHTKITPERIRSDNSYFNTYKYKGLPPYPVCAVSLPAIKAALVPAKSDYLYFMKNSGGTHDFSSSFKEHKVHIKKVKSDKKDINSSQ